MPMAEEVYKVLFEDKNARQATLDLMGRDTRGEGSHWFWHQMFSNPWFKNSFRTIGRTWCLFRKDECLETLFHDDSLPISLFLLRGKGMRQAPWCICAYIFSAERERKKRAKNFEPHFNESSAGIAISEDRHKWLTSSSPFCFSRAGDLKEFRKMVLLLKMGWTNLRNPQNKRNTLICFLNKFFTFCR